MVAIDLFYDLPERGLVAPTEGPGHFFQADLAVVILSLATPGVYNIIELKGLAQVLLAEY